MKKSFISLAVIAAVFAGCAKEIVAPEIQEEIEIPVGVVTLKAYVGESENKPDNAPKTKMSIDGHQAFGWQAGDVISVLNNSGEPSDFTTTGSGTTVDFSGSFASGSLGNYAMYPASDDHLAVGNEINFNLPGTLIWSADATNMPMLGKIVGNVGTFKAVGGVLKLVCCNIPSGAESMWFTSTNKQIVGDFTIADASITNPVICTSDKSDDLLAIDFSGNYNANKVFYIPLPTGQINGFTVSFYDGSLDELFSKTTSASFTVSRNQITIGPVLDCAAAPDKVLTNEEILASSIKGSYDEGSITSASGTWNYQACKQTYTDLGKTYIQIRNNATVSYLQLPSFDKNIASITLHAIANGSNGAYTGDVYLRSTADNSAASIASVTCSVGAREDLVLNIPSGYKTGYIMSSGACRFYSVTVKFEKVGSIPALTPDDNSLTISVGSSSQSTNVTYSNKVDDFEPVATVSAGASSWLSAELSGSYPNYVLTATAASANEGAGAREGTITLKASGCANKVVTVTQPTALVPNPIVSVMPGDAKFSASWTGDAHATSYVAYLHTTPTGTPASGGTNISASIIESAGAYSITDYAVSNGVTYYLYVKVNGVASNYVAPDVYVLQSFSPEEAKGTIDNPYSVSEAFNIIAGYGLGDESSTDLYTTGTVKSIDEVNTKYGNASYTITDGSKDIFVYRGFKGYNSGTSSFIWFESADELEVGDVVIICGKLKLHTDGTKEYAANNYIASLTKPHKLILDPDADILMDGTANSVYTLTVTTNYAWTAELDGDATTARGTSFDVLNASNVIIAGAISGEAGTTTIKFKAKGDGNGDGSTVTSYGKITFSDGTLSSQKNIKQAPKAGATPYSTGFEAAEGFTAASNYQSTVTDGPTGKKWEIYYGTVSTSSAITGSNSLAMRLYTSNNYAYAEMQFDVPGATGVSFKAKASTSNSAAIKVTIKESKDGGDTWSIVSGWSAKALTSSSAPYSFTVSGTPDQYRIRFEIDPTSTKPTKSNAQLTIDDFEISVD